MLSFNGSEDQQGRWPDQFPELEKMGPAVEVIEGRPVNKVIEGGPLKGLSIQVESLLSSPTLTAIRSIPTDLGSLSTDHTVTSLTAAPESTTSS
jgi:hypothetical protein